MRATRRNRNDSRPKDRALYVETFIRAPLERVWELTQDPHLHARWDARFSRITPTRLVESGDQEFTYELALPLHTIRGTGVSRGTTQGPHGERTSALLFDTEDRLSPLGRGRGYWRYIPEEHGVRFFTGYDYRPGWGALGRVLDPLITRRFVWWLTALSFDRLRIWAEDGVEPERLSWWTAWVPGRSPAPRARRCLSRPPTKNRGAAMQHAPASLRHLETEREQA
jgi:hypothetical protein